MSVLYVVKTVEVIKAFGEDYAINKYYFDAEPSEQKILECVDKDQAPRYELWTYEGQDIQSIQVVDMVDLDFVQGIKFGGVVKILFHNGAASSISITFDGELNGKPFEGIMGHIVNANKTSEDLKSNLNHQELILLNAATFQAYGHYNDLYMSFWKNPPAKLPKDSPFIDTDDIDDFFNDLDIPEQKL